MQQRLHRFISGRGYFDEHRPTIGAPVHAIQNQAVQGSPFVRTPADYPALLPTTPFGSSSAGLGAYFFSVSALTISPSCLSAS